MSYHSEVLKFLQQAKTESQAIKHFIGNYAGLKVRVSFGQGHLARVPWIAFLKGENTVRSGIYPVYLYFKSLDLLILAYGVSESAASNSWKIENPINLKDYFLKNNLGEIAKYGNSFFFKGYKGDKLNGSEIDTDLNKILEIYRGQ